MSGTRPSIRDIIKSGKFTDRNLNVYPDRDIKRDSSSTIDSEPSSPSDGSFTPRYDQAHEGSVMLMPLDLGIDGIEPDCYLTATPSIITYTSGRGYSTVRLEEINLPHRSLPTIEECPSPVELDEAPRDEYGFPIIAPPPDFKPIDMNMSEKEYANEFTAQLHTGATPHKETSPVSPSRNLVDPNNNYERDYCYTETTPPDHANSFSPADLGMSTGYAAWPLSQHFNQTPLPNYNAAVCSPQSPFSPGATTLQSTPRCKEFQDLKSRFSWCDADENHKNWFQRWIHDWWLLEITCLILSASFMAVVCILGWQYNGKELPASWAFGITLNALIAILAAFSRASLLFPAAEALGQIKWYFTSKGSKRKEELEMLDRNRNGPMDSIQLLARTKRITWGSSVAAMVLLALPMDFFFQQLVRYNTEWLIVATGTAAMSRSAEYSPYSTITTVGNATLLSPEPVLEASMYSFVLGQGFEVPHEFDCPTSNCTFPAFWTLALESQCQEMSSLLRRGCENGPSQWLPGVNTQPSSNMSYATGPSCGWYVDGSSTTGNGSVPHLMSGYATSGESKREALVGRMLPLRDIFTKQLTFGNFHSFNFKDIPYPVADFLVSATPQGVHGAYDLNRPALHECVVYWTARKVTSNVLEGKASYDTLEKKMLEYGGDPKVPAYLKAAASKFVGNYSMLLPDLENKMSIFSVDNFAARRATMVLEEIASSSWFGYNSTSPLQTKWLWNGNPPKVTLAPPQESDGWITEDTTILSTRLERLINTMNHVIWKTENASKQSKDMVPGKVWRRATIIRFKWPWIAVPAAVLLFTTLFILFSIFRTPQTGDGLGVWRTAALTVKVKKRKRLQKRKQ